MPLNATVSLVDNVAAAEEFLAWLGERRPILAIDTETTGFDWWTGRGFLRLVQFGDGARGWAVPVDEWRGVAREALALVQRDALPTAWWNVKFDMHALEADGLPTPAWHTAHDGATMHRLLYPLKPHGLKHAGMEAYGWAAGAGEDLRKAEFAKYGWDWDTVPHDRASYWAYGSMDTVLTARLVETMGPRVPAAPYEREMAVQRILYRAETRGVRIDPEYTSRLRHEWMAEEEELRTILEAAGIKNPNSNAQVAQVLKDIGWEPDEWTDTGQEKLDKVILKQLAERYPTVAEPLLRYKRIAKWRATYLDQFLLKRDAADHVHPSINTAQARTGRMSVTGFPFQTLPSGDHHIRTAVIPDDGRVLYGIDYDNMEFRAYAGYAGDRRLIQAFLDDEDIHTFTAALAHGIDQSEVTKEMRAAGKIRNFSRIYGAGARRIATVDGTSEAEVREFFRRMDARFPDAGRLAKDIEHAAKMRQSETGEPYIVTAGGRRLPQTPDKVYALTNYLIQGSCADIFKDALIRLDLGGLGDNIVMPVHDEVLFQFPEDGHEEYAREAHRLMEDHHTLPVPLTCSIEGPSQTWGDPYRKDDQ